MDVMANVKRHISAVRREARAMHGGIVVVRNAVLATVVAVIVLTAGCSAQRGHARNDRTEPADVFAPLSADVVNVGCRPSKLLMHDGRLFVASFRDKCVAVFDPTTWRLVKRLYLEAEPTAAPARPATPTPAPAVRRFPPNDLIVANGKLFVAGAFSDHVFVFDLRTLERVARVSIGGEGYLAAAPDGKKVYFALNTKPEFVMLDTERLSFETVAYPRGGHGIGAIAASPDGRRVVLGIHRDTLPLESGMPVGGYCFLAVYDFERKEYVWTPYLAEIGERGKADDSIPAHILFGPNGRLYVGMFQSRVGIHVIDPVKMRILEPISFARTSDTSPFQWVDPTQLAWYGKWLLSVNRHNGEIAVIEPTSSEVLCTLKLGTELGDVAGFVVAGDRAYVAAPTEGCLYVADLRPLARMLR